ncbi:MAG: hypothetical protein Q4C98_10410 [Capnocytophaga sp.]|nr:hypothetical protein [Capnocytophaga sp.]
MDYASETGFAYTDWKQINDPKLKIYFFQDQSEGEQITDNLLATRFIERIKAEAFEKEQNPKLNPVSDSFAKEPSLGEVILTVYKLEDSGFYSGNEKIKTTDGDEFTLSLWVADNFNRYISYNSLIKNLQKIPAPDRKSVRYAYPFNGTISGQEKEVLNARVLDYKKFNGVIFVVPNSEVVAFENSVLKFSENEAKKKKWLTALEENIKTENYKELQKYPNIALSLAGVDARLALFEKLSKQKLTTSNSILNAFFGDNVDKEILYVSLLLSIVDDQSKDQNNKLFNRFVTSEFEYIYKQVDDKQTRVKLYKTIGKLAALSDQQNVKNTFVNLINDTKFNEHYSSLLASILMGIDDYNVNETRVNLLTLLNDNPQNVAPLRRLYNRLEGEDQEYFNYYLSKWAKNYYYDNYQSLQNALDRRFQAGNISLGIDCSKIGIQYFKDKHIALNYIKAFGECSSKVAPNCNYLQIKIPNVDADTNYYFSYGTNRLRAECNNNKFIGIVHYTSGKPFSDFVALYFNESYEYANIKEGEVRIVPLFWAENFAKKHKEKLRGQELVIALETAGVLLTPFTGGQSMTAIKAISIVTGVSAIAVEMYENELLAIDGGEKFVEGVRLVNAVVAGGLLIKSVGNTAAFSFNYEKISSFIAAASLEDIHNLRNSFIHFLGSIKSGVITLTDEAILQMKALLYEMDLKASFRQIASQAAVKIKNDTKAFVVAANIEYEIASLRYLDALNNRNLLLSPSVEITSSVAGYNKVGILEDIYIQEKNNVKRTNVGIYTKEGKVVFAFDELAEVEGERAKLWTSIDEADGIFNGNFATYYDINVTYQTNRVRAGVSIYNRSEDLLEFHLNIPKELQQQGIGNEIFKRAIEDYSPSKIKGWWKKKDIYSDGESINLTIFKQKIKEGFSERDAVFSTPTGKILKSNGFDGEIKVIKNEIDEVIIHFSKK